MKKLFVLLFAAAAVTACGDASDLAEAVEDAAEQVEAAADDAADQVEAAADAAADAAEDAADAVEAPEAE